MSKPKILITGAGGIVGTALRPILAQQFDLNITARRSLDDLADSETMFVGDVCDPALMNEAMNGVDAVLHLACRHGFSISFEETLDVNYHATIALLDTAVRHNVKHVMFASSNHGWGFHKVKDTPIAANARPKPDGWYGISKIWGEAVLDYYSEVHGLSGTSFRIGHLNYDVPDERREHMWMSYNDFVRLIDAVIKQPIAGHRTVFATADCEKPYFDNSGLDALGFTCHDKPRDNLSNYAKQDRQPSPPETDIGGDFAKANRSSDT